MVLVEVHMVSPQKFRRERPIAVVRREFKNCRADHQTAGAPTAPHSGDRRSTASYRRRSFTINDSSADAAPCAPGSVRMTAPSSAARDTIAGFRAAASAFARAMLESAFFLRQWCRSGTKLRHAASPERLITEYRANDGGTAPPESLVRRPGATMMDDGRAARKQPVMWRDIQYVNRVGGGKVFEPAPAGRQQTTLISGVQSVEHDSAELRRVPRRHAAEADINGWQPRVEEARERRRWRPIAGMFGKPISSDIFPSAPIIRHGNEVAAERMKARNHLTFRAVSIEEVVVPPICQSQFFSAPLFDIP